MFAITLENIIKTYPGSQKHAVDQVSFQVEKGEILTLLGPSGCGKTTLLRLIAGFETADSGRIILGEKTVDSFDFWLPPEKRGVGMVFQDYALFPHINVWENVGFGYKEKDRKERIREVLALVGLEGYEARYPHQLSGGQQQRVALARALTRRPLVVLLDEPFSNLDADLREYMRKEIRRILKAAGTTAVFVSHDQKDALALSDRVVVIHEGVLQQEGTPRKIYQYPKNHFVANFIGKTNLIPGVISPDMQYASTCLGNIPVSEGSRFSPGEEVQVSVRPENIQVVGEGGLQAVVTSSVYKGEMIEAELEVGMVCGKKQLLTVFLHPDNVYSQGDGIHVKILPGHIHILENE